MFAQYRKDCFYATMRKNNMCGSLVRRVRGSAKNIFKIVADGLDCLYVNRCSAVANGIA